MAGRAAVGTEMIRAVLRTALGAAHAHATRVLVIATTLLVIWGNVWLHLDNAQTEALRHAYADAANLARLAEVMVTRTVEAVDQTLLTARELYRREKTGFTIPDWTRATAFLNGLNIQLAIADAQGLVVASSLGMPGTPVSIADREHFQFHRDGRDDQLFVSKPLVGRVSGRASVQFVRPIRDADGAFLGVIVASLDPAAIGRMFSALDIGGGQVLLTGDDGVIRAGWPAVAASGEATVPATLLAWARDTLEGTFRATEADGGWITGYHRIGTYPLLVVARVDPRDSLTPYHEEYHHDLLIGIGLTLLLFWLQFLHVRHRRRIDRFQQALTVTLANISQGLMMVDRHGTIVVINRRTVELLDLPPEIGRVGTRFQTLMRWQIEQGEFTSPEAARILAMMHRGGLDASLPVYERTRPNGRSIEVRTAVLADGSAVRTFTDLTERKGIERELAAARDSAEAGSRARSEFLRVMSHEIRTPLNGILGAVGLMRGLRLDVEADHYAAIVQQAGNHLLTLVDDVLDVASLDTGRLALKPAPFDPAEVVTGVVALSRPDAEAKDVTLNLDLDTSVPRLALGDGGRLRQILVNLVGNAVKFTDAGTVRVSASADRLAEGGYRLRIGISDTGIGIPADRRADLFRPFTQLDGSLSRRHGGTGMGLAICHHLVLLMDGSISIDSTEGAGSDVRFDIRLDPPPTPAPIRRSALSLRVLIAEDNPTNRLVATRMVSRMGHHVDAVEDGAEAIETLRRQRYDVVLMDLMMPRMDGITATRAIRAEPPPLDATPIIGLTANARADDKAACLAAGMDAFLSKPVSADRLSLTLLEVVGGGRPC